MIIKESNLSKYRREKAERANFFVAFPGSECVKSFARKTQQQQPVFCLLFGAFCSNSAENLLRRN